MSFVGAPSLIEFAIRVGLDDIRRDPNVLKFILNASLLTDQGRDLTPTGVTPKTFEKLPMDYFQRRLELIPKMGDETGLATSIFRNSNPKPEDVQRLLFEGNLKLIHGFPRSNEDIPCCSIVLGNEDEAGGVQYLATQREIFQANDGKRYRILGSDMAAQFNIQIMSTNYDETMAWYYGIKYALWAYRTHMEAYGLREQRMNWQDIEPASEYVQAGLFVYNRTCIVSGVLEESVLVPDDAFKELAFSLATPEGPVADSEQEIRPGDPE